MPVRCVELWAVFFPMGLALLGGLGLSEGGGVRLPPALLEAGSAIVSVW